MIQVRCFALPLFVIYVLFSDVPLKAGWIQWTTAMGGNNHEYLAVPLANGSSWHGAQAIAVSHGGYLATITSKTENDFVFSLIEGPEFWSGLAGPWIGGYQPPGSPEPAGGWRWVTDEAFSYMNWHEPTGEPNNAGGFENSIHFVRSSINGASRWNDFNGNANPVAFIIERPIPEPSSIGLLMLAGTSISGWRYRRSK